MPKKSIKAVLRERIKDKELVTRNDLETVAQKTGAHYHTVLSTWGAMMAKGEHDVRNQWGRAQIAAALYRNGFKKNSIADLLNTARSSVVTYIKAYEAFPEEQDRSPSLSFSHHVAAAGTDNPKAFLQKAEKEGWTLIKLKKHIKNHNQEQKETVNSADQEKKAVSAIAESHAKGWQKIEDIDKLVKRVSKETGLREKRVNSLIGDIFSRWEYRVWAQTMKIQRTEIRQLKNELQKRDIENCEINYLTNLTEENAKLQEELSETKKQLEASRKFSMSILKMLYRRNSLLVNKMSQPEKIKIAK